MRLIQETGKNPEVIYDFSRISWGIYQGLAKDFNTTNYNFERALRYSLSLASFLVDLELRGEEKPRVCEFIAKAVYDLTRQQDSKEAPQCNRCSFYTLPQIKQPCLMCSRNYHSKFEPKEV